MSAAVGDVDASEIDLAQLAVAWDAERPAIASEPSLSIVAEFVARVLPTLDPATAARLVGPIKTYVDATVAELRSAVDAARAQQVRGTLAAASPPPPRPARAGGYSLEQRMQVLKAANAIRLQRRRSGILDRIRAFAARRVAVSPTRRWASRARAPRSHRPAGTPRCRSPGRPGDDDPEPPLAPEGAA